MILCDTFRKYRRFAGKFYELAFPFGKKAWLLGTPSHRNVGDSAITVAEHLFLQRCGIPASQVREITVQEHKSYDAVIRRCVGRGDLILLHGGGNLGNIWPAEEHFRRHLLEEFPQNPKILFPQTMFFSDTEQGREEQQASVPYYNRSDHLVLTARETVSYAMMQSLYPQAVTLLTPDIVLSTRMEQYGVTPIPRRQGILCCLRADKERLLSDGQRTELETLVRGTGLELISTDMQAGEAITKENRSRIVAKKMEEFVSARLVVTDRLHGMIFAALTGTPCLVLPNNQHKVKASSQWLAGLPYIRFADSLDQAKELLPLLLAQQAGNFPAEAFAAQFVPLEEKIRAFWTQN